MGQEEPFPARRLSARERSTPAVGSVAHERPQSARNQVFETTLSSGKVGWTADVPQRFRTAGSYPKQSLRRREGDLQTAGHVEDISLHFPSVPTRAGALLVPGSMIILGSGCPNFIGAAAVGHFRQVE